MSEQTNKPLRGAAAAARAAKEAKARGFPASAGPAKAAAAEARERPERRMLELAAEAEDALSFAGDRLDAWAHEFNKLRGARQVPSAAVVRVNLQNVVNMMVLSRARPWLVPPAIAPGQKRSLRQLAEAWAGAMLPPATAPTVNPPAEPADQKDQANATTPV
jgi:hypothetical protein